MSMVGGKAYVMERRHADAAMFDVNKSFGLYGAAPFPPETVHCANRGA
jgi:hypothetical protein